MPHTSNFKHVRQGAAFALMVISASACASSFFQVSPTGEDGATVPAKKPATTVAKAPTDSAKASPPAKPVVDKPAPKVVEKKPVVKDPEKTAEKPAARPAATAKDSVKAINVAKPVAVAPVKPRDVSAEVVRDARRTAERPAAAPPFARRVEPVFEPPAVEPAPAASDSIGIAHLMHAAAVWDAIRLFHPAASVDRAAWDNTTVRRLTEVRSAKAAQQYSNVMTEWLSRLNDPVTRIVLANAISRSATNVAGGAATVSVVASPNVVAVARGKKPMPARDTTMVVTWPAGRPASDSAAWNAVRDATRNLQTAMHVVLDLRGAAIDTRAMQSSGVRALQTDVANNLATFPALGPSVRRRVYEGWPDERAAAGTAFAGAGWRVSDALAVVTGNNYQYATVRRVAIIADSSTEMPPALLALVASRQATLIAEGVLSDAALVPTTTIAIGDGLAARIRTGELLNADGTVGIRPDTTVYPSASSDSAPALKVAIGVASGLLSPRALVLTAPLSSDASMVSSAWNGQHYPIMGARLLGAFKMYGTLRTFHAYSDLHDEDLDETFQRIIPRVEAARDADAYAAAMLDFSTTLDDAQAVVTGPSVTQRIGAASVPFRVRWIENRAIVTQVASGAATGVVVGDEITAADGYPMPAYISEHRRYGAASNDWTRLRNIMEMIPRGPAGDAIFRTRDAANRERAITLQRTAEFSGAFPATERYATSAVRVLGAGIGYIDIDRLTAQNVDSALAAFASMRAIVFDARVNRVIAPAILARIVQHVSAQPRAVADKEALRVATEPCEFTTTTLSSCAVERRTSDGIVSVDTAQHFRGRVVVLIDERTQGALESFGLAMESVTNTVFIGSPSAGASGAISALTLPGQLAMTFSGSDVRHADGRQLQRVGLTPQIDAHPTVKNVRAGLDDTIDAAQKWLALQLNPAPAKRPK